MSRISYRGLVFDCDGTIANTAPFHYQSLHMALREQGLYLPHEWYLARVDFPGPSSFLSSRRNPRVNLAAVARSYLGTDNVCDGELTSLPEVVAREAAANDPRALASVESLAHHLCLGIITLVNVFNPASVVLGGVMRPILEQCLETIRSKVSSGIVPGVPMPEVCLSPFGVYESAIGAASLAHHRTFDVVDVDFAVTANSSRPSSAAE